MNEKTTILIVEDHPLVLDGIKKTLNHSGDFQLIGSASDGVEAIELARKHQPAVVILDISLPTCSGLDLCPIILESVPKAKVIFLTMHVQLSHIRKALKNGALGYVLKSAPVEQLLWAIRHALKGECFLSPAVTKLLIGDFLGQKDRPKDSTNPPSLFNSPLTARELQVLEIYLTGASSKEIAQILCLSPKTVDKHRANIFEKTKSSSPVDLLRFAVEHNIVDLDNWV
ncbi:MAG: response regulator transcription factor [Desulfobulbaceae bacterium]|nr:response regulator transcription factor [Desulfobulbaceae bacterium]